MQTQRAPQGPGEAGELEDRRTSLEGTNSDGRRGQLFGGKYRHSCKFLFLGLEQVRGEGDNKEQGEG